MPDYKINRLFVIAGPRAIGKSTFLRDPAARISVDILPEELRPLVDNPPPLVNAMQMIHHQGKELGDIRLHVDLMLPLEQRGMAKLHISNFQEILTSKMYSSWNALNCISDAREVYFVTLFLPHQALFQRWLTRVMSRPGRMVRKNVVFLYGDSVNGMKALKALYAAWVDFVNSQAPQCHSALNVGDDKYRFHSNFKVELITN